MTIHPGAGKTIPIEGREIVLDLVKASPPIFSVGNSQPASNDAPATLRCYVQVDKNPQSDRHRDGSKNPAQRIPSLCRHGASIAALANI
jgi:hypothetical protein